MIWDLTGFDKKHIKDFTVIFGNNKTMINYLTSEKRRIYKIDSQKSLSEILYYFSTPSGDRPTTGIKKKNSISS